MTNINGFDRLFKFAAKSLQKTFGFITVNHEFKKDEMAAVSGLVGVYDQEVIEEYEEAFSKVLGGGHCVSFASARMALYAILSSLDIGRGDEVIITGFTCAVVPNAVLRAGAIPVYCDISVDNFGTCSKSLSTLITSRTRVIIAQHTFGIPCDIDRIAKVAKINGIILVEDCALSLGSKLKGRSLGTYGDFAIFSTDHSKPINTMTGGMVYSSSAKNIKLVRAVQTQSKELPKSFQQSLFFRYKIEQTLLSRDYYFFCKLLMRCLSFLSKLRLISFKSLNKDFSHFVHSSYPYPAKLPAFSAKIGLLELKKWEKSVKKRQDFFYKTVMWLTNHDVSMPKRYFDKSSKIVPLRIICLHSDSSLVTSGLKSMFDQKWFWFRQPIAEAQCRLEKLGYRLGDCPNAEFIGKRIINIPCNQNNKVMRIINKNILALGN